MALDELEHQFRVVDQLISMHCMLRDRYERRALLMDIVQLVISVILAATVFMEPTRLGLTPRIANIVIGSSSLTLFSLALVSLRVGWKEAAGRYAQSGKILSELKGQCRELRYEPAEANAERIQAVCAECRKVLPTLPPVPEGDFIRLKVNHQRKAALSKMISEHPTASVWLMRLILWWQGNKALIAPQEDGCEGSREGE